MLTYAPMRSRARLVRGALGALGLYLIACRPASEGSASVARPVTGPVDASRPLPVPLPVVAAKVNGQPILTLRVAALARQRPDRGTEGKPNPVVLREALQQLMERELLFEEAVARSIVPAALDVEQFYDGLRTGDTAEWTARLSREGLSPDALREEVRIQATVVALLATLARPAAAVTEEQARAVFDSNPDLAQLRERYLASQIFIPLDPGASTEQRQQALERAQRARSQLELGVDLGAVAREVVADGVQSRELPATAVGSQEPAIEAALGGLQPGGVSEVVATKDGLRVFKLRSRLPAETLSFEQALPDVRGYIVDGERKRAVEALLKDLEARARIETFL